MDEQCKWQDCKYDHIENTNFCAVHTEKRSENDVSQLIAGIKLEANELLNEPEIQAIGFVMKIIKKNTISMESRQRIFNYLIDRLNIKTD